MVDVPKPPDAGLRLPEGLLDAARGGEPGARDRLCRLLEPALRRYVRRGMGPRLRRWFEPEDIVQPVLHELMAGLDRLPTVDAESELVRRLFGTARWRLKDAFARRRRDAGESEVSGGSAATTPADEPSTGPVTMADNHRWLEELVRRLPPSYGEVVRLCGLEGLDYEAAAQRLGLRTDTVRKRYERARDRLRERVAARRRRSHD